MLGRCRQGDLDYVIVRQPDNTLAHLPRWMTEPEAGRVGIVTARDRR